MEILLPLITLAGVQLLAVISPGQSFIVVSKLALSSGRRSALGAALGMGAGSVIWAMSAIAGLAFILEKAAWLYGLMKLAGGLYLLFLAFKLWKHAPERPDLSAGSGRYVTPRQAFTLGLVTQLANPKVVVFFGSIFFALLPASSAPWVYVASLVIVFCNETGWYGFVSMFFSTARTQLVYFRAKTWIDRIMAGALGVIGIGLAMDARETLAR
ncbi:LysE family translocator [Paracoccus alkanivorans]|nr:LysE family transporter [Paracoccus alkanivorans]